MLAGDASTMPAAKKLVAGGEAVDQVDNDGMTALALALLDDELETAQRLIDLGASVETTVTTEAIPVALLPVSNRNLAAIGFLRRAGVDYSKLRYRGVTVVDLIKESGDFELLEALVGTETSTL